MKQLIGICGIDCEKCDARIATLNDDNALREKTAKLWGSLNNIEIPTEAINCMGCRTEGIKTLYCLNMCEIKKCATSKGYDTCAECDTLKSCELIQPIASCHHDIFENLKNK